MGEYFPKFEKNITHLSSLFCQGGFEYKSSTRQLSFE